MEGCAYLQPISPNIDRYNYNEIVVQNPSLIPIHYNVIVVQNPLLIPICYNEIIVVQNPLPFPEDYSGTV